MTMRFPLDPSHIDVDDLGGREASVTQEQDLAAIARSIVDANRFMVLGTADASGRPWVSPVWYALLSYREYVWVSRPGTRHSRNLAARPEVAIAIYDSHRPGSWTAVYTAAVAEERTAPPRAHRSCATTTTPAPAGAAIAQASRHRRVPSCPSILDM
jgi:nitroimidazol reductase NimA-like FMN-containing flavoprotein (pyridoxamine 5'-phosphate oxidase superfamily)